MFFDHLPLSLLYARFDAIAEGRARGDSSAAHVAILNRLAANQHLAESLGWTACAFERSGGTGRLCLWGVPPSGTERERIPQWIQLPERHLLHRVARSAEDTALHQARYNELKAGIRGRLAPFYPSLGAGDFERLATRMATVALKYDRPSSPDSPPGTPVDERARTLADSQ